MKKLVGLKNKVFRSDGTTYNKVENDRPTDKPALVKDIISDFIDNYGLPSEVTPSVMAAFKENHEYWYCNVVGISVDELELEDADYETLKMVCHKMQHIKVARVVVQVMDVIDNPVKIDRPEKKKDRTDRLKNKKKK